MTVKCDEILNIRDEALSSHYALRRSLDKYQAIIQREIFKETGIVVDILIMENYCKFYISVSLPKLNEIQKFVQVGKEIQIFEADNIMLEKIGKLIDIINAAKKEARGE